MSPIAMAGISNSTFRFVPDSHLLRTVPESGGDHRNASGCITGSIHVLSVWQSDEAGFQGSVRSPVGYQSGGSLFSSCFWSFFFLSRFHHWRRTGFSMFHFDGQMTQNGIVEFECGFQFVQVFHRRIRCSSIRSEPWRIC